MSCHWLFSKRRSRDVTWCFVNSRWPTKLTLYGSRVTVEICEFSRLDLRLLWWKWISASQIRMAMACCMQALIKTKVWCFSAFDFRQSGVLAPTYVHFLSRRLFCLRHGKWFQNIQLWSLKGKRTPRYVDDLYFYDIIMNDIPAS